jgi:hypothetical protein
MKTQKRFRTLHSTLRLLLFCLLPSVFCLPAFSQGTAFTYQGRLDSGGNAANGFYDLRFAIYDMASGGAPQGSAVTNAATAVSNGLFTVTLDFGNQFPGAARWLDIGVRTNGGGAFVPLSPRQALLPAPYAIHAAKALDVVNGSVLNPLFIGTTTAIPLDFFVAGVRAMRFEPDPQGPDLPNVIGGAKNTVTSGVSGATISGGGNEGMPNRVTDDYGTISGGRGNQAGDGAGTTSNQPFATVGGGLGNRATGGGTTVGGGFNNTASSDSSTVGGGRFNMASGTWSTVGGGSQNTASFYSTVGGGVGSMAGGNISTVGGGQLNAASGPWSTVSGGEGNAASVDWSTVGGGYDNAASGTYSSVGGGNKNTASGSRSAVGGGNDNRASGSRSIVGGGGGNTASGEFSTVPGGFFNQAGGDSSFAAGRSAIVRDAATVGNAIGDRGTFVWADSTFSPFVSDGENRFLVRSTGGARFYSSANLATGVSLAPNDGSWTSVSDRNLKENIVVVDGREVLERLSEIPIATWNYKAQDPSIRHIGPMGQDFHAAFGVGAEPPRINTVDADGVALAAIQGLNQKVESGKRKTETRMGKLEAENLELKARLAKLEQQLLNLTEKQQ